MAAQRQNELEGLKDRSGGGVDIKLGVGPRRRVREQLISDLGFSHACLPSQQS